jgi:integrase
LLENVKPASTQQLKAKSSNTSSGMQKQGYADSTIRLNRTCLKMLIVNGANLIDPESVKVALTKYKASPNRKRNVINSYTQFLKLNGMSWEKPKNTITQKFPFIPLEKELDALITGGNKKMSSFLQLLKETAMRCGEAKRLKWTDIDFEKNVITLNEPEKGSLARMWRVTSNLISMLNLLPKENIRVFGKGNIHSFKATYTKMRKRLAFKLQNPRLLRIGFHTFRHWKATQLYHETKDPWYVKQFLGHKCVKSTEVYINIERSTFESANDSFTVKVAQTPEEIQQLLETGFEYVCQKDNLIFLRKRK